MSDSLSEKVLDACHMNTGADSAVLGILNVRHNGLEGPSDHVPDSASDDCHLYTGADSAALEKFVVQSAVAAADVAQLRDGAHRAAVNTAAAPPAPARSSKRSIKGELCAQLLVLL